MLSLYYAILVHINYVSGLGMAQKIREFMCMYDTFGYI